LIQEIQIRILAAEFNNQEIVLKTLAKALKISQFEIKSFKLLKKSIDARQSSIYFQLKYIVATGEELKEKPSFKPLLKSNPSNKKAIIIGAGPAGLFAAIKLLERGITPIIIERGKTVRDRRRDLADINKKQIVNPNSNYCFGEGGAGTYSDGKLYTRSNKRGDINSVLDLFIYFGADENIAIDAHPHIGTNKLPKIIENIRAFIIDNGGEFHFHECVTNFIIKNNEIKGVTTKNTENESTKEFLSENVILATGHSARDIFSILNEQGVLIENKPFALGVRVEHPQEIIDTFQYKSPNRPDYLPPASYSLVTQTKEKAVFSFCMCPGGIIAPCATAPGEIVTNGWSPSKRNNKFANSGIVVPIEESDWQKYNNKGNLAALEYQKSVEQQAFKFGGGGQVAPAQRLVDFIENKFSQDLPITSYQPGLKSVITDDVLPQNITKALRQGFSDFGKKINSFLTNDAVIHITESRTSSPVRIPRDKQTLVHPQIKGLYPCGEGAGYAGGIMSAAIDGQKCADAIADLLD
jgi:hypothetical protein